MQSDIIEVAKELLSGKWVDCRKVQEAFGIDFRTGFRIFELQKNVRSNLRSQDRQPVNAKFRLPEPDAGYNQNPSTDDCKNFVAVLTTTIAAMVQE